MERYFKNATLISENGIKKTNLSVSDKDGFSFDFSSYSAPRAEIIENAIIFPGFVDVHTHLREPGFSYKETIKSGSMAAARGGFTHICAMPNLKPCPDSAENLELQMDIIRRDAVIDVLPYGTITVGQAGCELSDMQALLKMGAVAFSDDGKGVQSADMMRAAMIKAKELDSVIAAHCEDNSLLFGGYIHDGDYARAHSHKGICSESEWGPIARDIELVREIGCKYHVCHISTKESVELIRKAKQEGVNITCETAPHYLVMDDSNLMEHGRFKMNPPLRSAADREALIEGIVDGTIDMIATDHAPHSGEEKSKGLEKSAFGVVGIETSFAVMYTDLVKRGIITLERLCELMVTNPKKRFGIKSKTVENGEFCVFDVSGEYEINPNDFLSLGRATPFEGKKVFGECLMTVYNGQPVYVKEKL